MARHPNDWPIWKYTFGWLLGTDLAHAEPDKGKPGTQEAVAILGLVVTYAAALTVSATAKSDSQHAFVALYFVLSLLTAGTYCFLMRASQPDPTWMPNPRCHIYDKGSVMTFRYLWCLSIATAFAFTGFYYGQLLPGQSPFSQEVPLELGKAAVYHFEQDKLTGVTLTATLSPKVAGRPLPEKANLVISLPGALAKEWKVPTVDGRIGEDGAQELIPEQPALYIDRGHQSIWLLDGLKADGRYTFTILVHPETKDANAEKLVQAINGQKGIKVAARMQSR